MMNLRKIFCVAAVTTLIGIFSVSNIALAAQSSTGTMLAKEEVIGEDGYNKTYNDSAVSFKDRMKDARETPVITVANTHGGFTLGFTGDFGPVFDAEPSAGSGMGFGLGITPGYLIQSETWTRLEFGAEIAYHSFTWKNGQSSTATMSPFSVVPQVGIGHNLGNNLFGIVRLGFGFATGSVASKIAASSTTGAGSAKTNSANGFVLSGAYDVTFPSNSMQFFGGIGATHYQYSFSDSTNNGVTTAVDSALNINHVNLHAGLRLKF